MLPLAVWQDSEWSYLLTVAYLARSNDRPWPNFGQLQHVIMIAVPGNRDTGLPNQEHRNTQLSLPRRSEAFSHSQKPRLVHLGEPSPEPSPLTCNIAGRHAQVDPVTKRQRPNRYSLDSVRQR